MKRTVYITQIPSRREGTTWVPTVDVAPAREHGELKVILPSGLNYPEAAPAIALLKKALAVFEPQLDFILPVGDRQQHRYFPFEVSL